MGLLRCWSNAWLWSLETLSLFFYDETSDDISELLTLAAAKLGIVIISRRIPTKMQADFRRGDDLALDDFSAMSDAMAVITCLGDHAAGLEYRRALLRFGASADKRLAHMPGARPEFFGDAIDVDYGPIVKRCDDLAFAMAVGQTARVRSYVFDVAGEPTEEHQLSFSLGGIERLPVVSTGGFLS